MRAGKKTKAHKVCKNMNMHRTRKKMRALKERKNEGT